MNVFKQVVSKSEYELSKSKLKLINKTHHKYFSIHRLHFLRIWRIVARILSILAVTICSLLISLLISFFLFVAFKEKDSSFLLTFAIAMLGVAVAFFIGISIAVLIGLSSSNEYFNKTELVLFFELDYLSLFTCGYLSFLSFVYIVYGTVGLLIPSYIDSIFGFFLSVLLSLVVLLRFISYKKRNKHERFAYYLKHSRYYHKINQYDLVYDYFLMLNLTDKKSKEVVDSKALYLVVIKRMHFIQKFIDELPKMISRDERTVVEQNIIEEYFIELSQNIKTPIELFSFFLTIQFYLNAIKSAKDGIKEAKKTYKNLFLSVSNAFDASKKMVESLSICVDDLPSTIFLDLDFYDRIFIQYRKLIFAQVFICGCCELIETDLKARISPSFKELKKKFDEIDGKILELKRLSSFNIDSEDRLIDKIKKDADSSTKKILDTQSKQNSTL